MFVIVFMASGLGIIWYNAGIGTALGVYLVALAVAAYDKKQS